MEYVRYIDTWREDVSQKPPDVLKGTLQAAFESLLISDHWTGRVPHFVGPVPYFDEVYVTFISLARNLHAFAIGDYWSSLANLILQQHLHLREISGIIPGEGGEVRLGVLPTTGYNPLLVLLWTMSGLSRLTNMDGGRFDRESRETFYRHKPQQVPIEEIVVDNCNLNDKAIEILLQVCTSLRRFVCRWSMIRDNILGVQINLEALRRHLAPLQQSLECLVLDTLESTWQVGLDENIPTIGSLRDFAALKHLDVSGMVLWSDDDTIEQPRLATILPPNLETLIINVEWDDYVEAGLVGLSKDCTSQLPNLKSVNCSWRPAPRPIAEALIAEFKDAGVTLELAIAGPTEEDDNENA